jgi:hypothetical protein
MVESPQKSDKSTRCLYSGRGTSVNTGDRSAWSSRDVVALHTRPDASCVAALANSYHPIAYVAQHHT